jgi:hypothetical protein
VCSFGGVITEAEKFDENKHRVASKIIGNHGAGGYGN